MRRQINRILVVDDMEIMRDLLAEVLESDGYQVDKAVNGLEAIELVRKNHYDLIFCDVHMPKQNGLVTVRQIRQTSPATRVVMTDSYPDKQLEALEREGAISCICKPFDLSELRQILQDMEKRTAEDQKVV